MAIDARMHRFTLRFEDDALEARFAEREAGRVVRLVRIALVLGTVMLAIMSVGHVLAPPALRIVPEMGSTVVAVLALNAAIYAFSGTATFRRHVQLWQVVLLLSFAVAITLSARLMAREVFETRGYLLMLMHTLVLCTMVRLRFPAAAAVEVLSLLIYFVVLSGLGALGGLVFWRHLFWLGLTGLWGLVACWQLDAAARREFGALALLDAEKERSERLLLNVLPATVADRLKASAGVIADHADDVTVLFADIVGFTPLSARKTPHELVAVLDRIFTRFDALADEHGLEKIKTIGDAYMAVAGLPEPCADHAQRAARMALAMQEALRDIAVATGEPLALRIGLHSGPVVAGVIGRRKFIYDLWGDTVNTASRMESHGVAGSVQCSAATAALLEGAFVLDSRGVSEVKGKGTMETFLVREGGAVATRRATLEAVAGAGA